MAVRGVAVDVEGAGVGVVGASSMMMSVIMGKTMRGVSTVK